MCFAEAISFIVIMGMAIVFAVIINVLVVYPAIVNRNENVKRYEDDLKMCRDLPSNTCCPCKSIAGTLCCTESGIKKSKQFQLSSLQTFCLSEGCFGSGLVLSVFVCELVSALIIMAVPIISCCSK